MKLETLLRKENIKIDPASLLTEMEELDREISANISVLKKNSYAKKRVREANREIIKIIANTLSAPVSNKIQEILDNKEILAQLNQAITYDLTKENTFTELLDLYNMQSEYVRMSILSIDDYLLRHLMLERFIYVAWHLTQKQDYFSAQAMYDGFMHSYVTRLIEEDIQDEKVIVGLTKNALSTLEKLKSFYSDADKLHKYIEQKEGPKLSSFLYFTKLAERNKGKRDNIAFRQIVLGEYKTLAEAYRKLMHLRAELQTTENDDAELLENFRVLNQRFYELKAKMKSDLMGSVTVAVNEYMELGDKKEVTSVNAKKILLARLIDAPIYGCKYDADKLGNEIDQLEGYKKNLRDATLYFNRATKTLCHALAHNLAKSIKKRINKPDFLEMLKLTIRKKLANHEKTDYAQILKGFIDKKPDYNFDYDEKRIAAIIEQLPKAKKTDAEKLIGEFAKEIVNGINKTIKTPNNLAANLQLIIEGKNLKTEESWQQFTNNLFNMPISIFEFNKQAIQDCINKLKAERAVFCEKKENIEAAISGKVTQISSLIVEEIVKTDPQVVEDKKNNLAATSLDYNYIELFKKRNTTYSVDSACISEQIQEEINGLAQQYIEEKRKFNRFDAAYKQVEADQAKTSLELNQLEMEIASHSDDLLLLQCYENTLHEAEQLLNQMEKFKEIRDKSNAFCTEVENFYYEKSKCYKPRGASVEISPIAKQLDKITKPLSSRSKLYSYRWRMSSGQSVSASSELNSETYSSTSTSRSSFDSSRRELTMLTDENEELKNNISEPDEISSQLHSANTSARSTPSTSGRSTPLIRSGITTSEQKRLFLFGSNSVYKKLERLAQSSIPSSQETIKRHAKK